MSPDAEIVLATFRAVEQRDREGLFALYHDEVEFHDPPSLPYGGSIRGREAMAQQLEDAPQATWIGTWGPLQPTDAERRMDPRVVGDRDGEVAVSYIQRALSPSGERFESPVMGLYEVRDGKFARAQMFHYDTAAVVAFLDRAGDRSSATGVFAAGAG